MTMTSVNSEERVKRSRDLDRVISQNVRAVRIASGKTQEGLGAELGLTFQQVQKFEKGVNRISAGRLVAIARALDVPVEQFFDGVDAPQELKDDPARALGASRDGVALARAFNRIADPRHRHLVIRMAETLVAVQDERARRGR